MPPGYVVHRIGHTWLVLDAAQIQPLVGLRLADPAEREALFNRGVRRGRGATPTVQITPTLSALLRRYRHGGILAWITGALFWGPSRALSELRVTSKAEAHGAPVPHVLCLVLWPVLGPFWSALIGTLEESQAQDLGTVLQASQNPRERWRLLREVGAAIRRLHDAGVEHRDLQLRNLIATNSGARRIVVVDLDRARFHRHTLLHRGRRAANLGRLVRSVIKLGLWPEPFGRRELAALIGGYTQNNRQLRAEMRAWVGWEKLKLLPHLARYRFSRLTTRGGERLPPRPA